MTLPLIRAKVEFFLEAGYEPHGVVHIGANDGEEIPWYIHRLMTPVLAFEPHPDAFAQLVENFKDEPDVKCVPAAIGSSVGVLTLLVPEGAGTKGSSKFRPIPTPGHPWTAEQSFAPVGVPVMPFSFWADGARWDPAPYDVLVVDVQGMELDVLESMGDLLDGFQFLNIECSEEPVYDGEAPAREVVGWLEQRGFRAVSPIESHDDIFFVGNDAVRW